MVNCKYAFYKTIWKYILYTETGGKNDKIMILQKYKIEKKNIKRKYIKPNIRKANFSEKVI